MLPYQDPTQPIDLRVEDLLARLSLEEKAGQMNQIPNDLSWMAEAPINNEGLKEWIRSGKVGSLICAESAVAGNDTQSRVRATRLNALQKIACEESRLGIPLLFARDVIHGHRTVAPIPLAQAASWNPAAIQAAAAIAAKEAAADGIHWTFTPMVDIGRDARWGRVAEGFGEDPFLSATCTRAAVEGYQGHDLSHPEKIAACLKHFVGYGAAEGGRDYNTVEITDYTLHNVYMPSFRAGLAAGAATVMCAFQQNGGIPATASKRLLTDLLKTAHDWDGMVITDWATVKELIAHGVAEDLAEASSIAAHAGVDMDMCSWAFVEHLPHLVRTGLVDAERVDDAVRRILRLKFRLGLFERPYTDETLAARVHGLPESRQTVEALAAETLVLLKNEGPLLPLHATDAACIGLWGPMAEATGQLFGTWTLDGVESDVPSLKQALSARLDPWRLKAVAQIDDALSVARLCDAFIVALGESPGRSGEANSVCDIGLPPGQLEAVRALRRKGVPIVAVVFCGRPLALEELAREVDAIVLAWHPGIAGGQPVADLLFGELNPSGRLPITFPRSSGQVPLYYNRHATGRPTEPSNRRSDQRYGDLSDAPLYPFGWGLSYTTFALTAPTAAPTEIAPDGTVCIRVEVSNTGLRAGSTVVQLYVRDPVAQYARPIRELKAFRKIHLDPGASEALTFYLSAPELGYTHPDGRFVLEPGRFQVWASLDSASGETVEFTVRP